MTAPPRQYSQITACPNTQAERDRIDALARKADEAWEAERAAHGRMTDAQAFAQAKADGFHPRRSHGCERSKSRRAIKIHVTCELWIARAMRIPGFGVGESLDHGTYSRTWEEAFRIARTRRKARELDKLAQELSVEARP